MTEAEARIKPPRVIVEAVVLRAVPCDEHRSVYVQGCANCLTGAQAAALGVTHGRDDLGTVADSRKRWRFGLGRVLARRRTRLANERNER